MPQTSLDWELVDISRYHCTSTRELPEKRQEFPPPPSLELDDVTLVVRRRKKKCGKATVVKKERRDLHLCCRGK